MRRKYRVGAGQRVEGNRRIGVMLGSASSPCRTSLTAVPVAGRGSAQSPPPASAAPDRRRYGPRGGASPRFTVTLFFCVKLSIIPSRENSRPIPLCLMPP